MQCIHEEHVKRNKTVHATDLISSIQPRGKVKSKPQRGASDLPLAQTVVLANEYAGLLSQGRFTVEGTRESMCEKLAVHLRELAAKYNLESIEVAAERAAADFEWPPDAFTRDAELVVSEGSFIGAIKAKLQAMKGNRFNAQRVNAMFKGDVEYDTLMDVAVNGARIEIAPDLVLDPECPEFRKNQLRMPKKNQLRMQLVVKRKGYIDSGR